jgi:protein-arginine kinase activator protein McsA
MKCQICGRNSEVHITEIREGEKYQYFLCNQHQSAASDGSVKPLTNKEANQKMREELELSATDSAELNRLKGIFPEIFNESPDPENCH